MTLTITHVLICVASGQIWGLIVDGRERTGQMGTNIWKKNAFILHLAPLTDLFSTNVTDQSVNSEAL